MKIRFVHKTILGKHHISISGTDVLYNMLGTVFYRQRNQVIHITRILHCLCFQTAEVNDFTHTVKCAAKASSLIAQRFTQGAVGTGLTKWRSRSALADKSRDLALEKQVRIVFL